MRIQVKGLDSRPFTCILIFRKDVQLGVPKMQTKSWKSDINILSHYGGTLPYSHLVNAGTLLIPPNFHG